MSHIALLSFYTRDFQPLHDVNGPVKDTYCAHHGYQHLVKVGPYRANPRYYAFDRLAYVRDLFFGDLPEGRGVEVIAVLNGHAQVMTHTVKIESFLEDGKDFYIAADCNGLNAGVFIIRKSDWSKAWLDFLFTKEDEVDFHDWKEQFAMQRYWEVPEWRERIKLVPQEMLNAYLWQHYNWSESTPGQFIKGKSWALHIPGRSVRADPQHNLMQSRIALFTSPEVLNLITWN